MSFASLGLIDPLLRNLQDLNYQAPTPVQAKAIPAVLGGKDVMAGAQTGTGKTAGFALPLLQRLVQHGPAVSSNRARVLVLVPTRELAEQVLQSFIAYGKGLDLRFLAAYGGVSINPQMIHMRGVEVLVATPGRLLDLLGSNALYLDEVETLVLDEADKVLSLGFKEELDKVFALLPPRRQNLLFSATLGEDVVEVMGKMLHDPVRIEVKGEEGPAPASIQQLAYHVALEKKGPLLRYLIREGDWQQVLVFASAIRTADNLAQKLNKHGITAEPFHSQMSQGGRTAALKMFKEGKLRVLVATDLASRGIDIVALPVVVNFELPRSPQDYVHRIGRTGRAAAEGLAVSIITQEDIHHFKVIQKKMKHRVPMIWTDELDLHGQ